ncbi:MAG: hypothetical protein ACP5EQ_07760 [Candidatus Cloacimonadia bacterium]
MEKVSPKVIKLSPEDRKAIRETIELLRDPDKIWMTENLFYNPLCKLYHKSGKLNCAGCPEYDPGHDSEIVCGGLSRATYTKMIEADLYGTQEQYVQSASDRADALEKLLEGK